MNVRHDNNRARQLLAQAIEPLEPRRLLSFGALDPTFGAGGKVLTDIHGGWNPGNAMAVSGGKILVAGQLDGDFVLAREQVLATVQALFDRRDASHPPPTVVFITHHVEELPPATSHVLLLDQGRAAAQGAPADVLRADTLSRVYRCPVDVRQQAGRYYIEVHPTAWRDLLHRA